MSNDTKIVKGRTIIIYTAIITPVLLFLALIFMDGGHGTNFFSRLFFPIPMGITEMNDEMNDSTIYLAIIQTPIYGLLLFIFRNYKWKIVVFLFCLSI